MKEELAPKGDRSQVQDFYRGTSVFVTGGSGFMGKVLVEKLLRSCPHITRIFLLLRPKRGKGVEERVDDLLASPCFEMILKENPKIKSKLVAISGDISQVGLGLSEADLRLLRDHVNVVFHMAATVRFNDPLKDAIFQNVRGTRDVLSLCRTFTKLKSVIHVSTAFSNCPLSSIDEVLYDSPLESEIAITLAENTTQEELDQQLTRLLGKWPNTYSYSKAISEHAVKVYGKGLPVGIVRPSVVLTCANEPMPGWCDTAFGPMGFSIAMATGVAKTLYVKADNVCNFVPCDIANNCIITAAWDVSNKSNLPEPFVYNCATPTERNLYSWRDAYHFLIRDTEDFPPMQSLWYINCFFTNNRPLTLVLRVLLHFLPALIMDSFSFVFTGKTRLVKMYTKLHTFSDACNYFTSGSWHFQVEHVDEMWKKLGPTDRKLFPFDFQTFNWESYYKTYWFGIWKYVLKNKVESIPKAKSKLRKLYLLQCCILYGCSGMLAWTLWPFLGKLWAT